MGLKRQSTAGSRNERAFGRIRRGKNLAVDRLEPRAPGAQHACVQQLCRGGTMRSKRVVGAYRGRGPPGVHWTHGPMAYFVEWDRMTKAVPVSLAYPF